MHPLAAIALFICSSGWVQSPQFFSKDMTAPTLFSEVANITRPPSSTELQRRRNETFAAATIRRLSTENDAAIAAVSVVEIITYVAFQCVLLIGIPLIIAWTYKSKVTDNRDPFPSSLPDEWSLSGGRDFRFGIFECFDDIQYCLHGWCCLAVRLGDTYQMTGLNSFWLMVFGELLVFFGVAMLSIPIVLLGAMISPYVGEILGNSSFYIAQSICAVYLATQRGKLREKLGGASDNFWLDCCCYWWCSCCVAVQEARHVDGMTNTDVECCCKLNKKMPAHVVMGEPVVVKKEIESPENDGRENV